MSKGKFALGAIFGAAIGVVAGILTAPKSGKETRAELKAKANDYKTDATEKATEVKAKAEKAVDDVKTKATAVVEDVKDKALDYKERSERAAEAAKKGFQSKK